METRQARQKWLTTDVVGGFSRKELLDIILSFRTYPARDETRLMSLNEFVDWVATEFRDHPWPDDKGVRLSAFQRIRKIMYFVEVVQPDTPRNFGSNPITEEEFQQLKMSIRALYGQAGLREPKMRSPSSPGIELHTDAELASPPPPSTAEQFRSRIDQVEGGTTKLILETLFRSYEQEKEARDETHTRQLSNTEQLFQKERADRRSRLENSIEQILGKEAEDEHKGNPFPGAEGGGAQLLSTLRF